jgi:hypothetical protein
MVKVKVLEGQQLANEEEGGVHEAGAVVDLDEQAAERAVQMGVAEMHKASSSSSGSSGSSSSSSSGSSSSKK